jgi:hypothetical protein
MPSCGFARQLCWGPAWRLTCRRGLGVGKGREKLLRAGCAEGVLLAWHERVVNIIWQQESVAGRAPIQDIVRVQVAAAESTQPTGAVWC